MQKYVLLICFVPVASLTPFTQNRPNGRHVHAHSRTRANASSLAVIEVSSQGSLQSALRQGVPEKAQQHIENTLIPEITTKNNTISVLHDAMHGGIAGMAAGMLQVICLMWLHTVMTYQYFHGGTLFQTFESLWAEGGITRFYQGLGFALIQNPLARFGGTFAQSAATSLFGQPGAYLPGVALGFVVATFGACWRLGTVPLDTWRTTAQVHGTHAQKIFAQRFRVSGLLELWSGALAMFVLVWSSSLPWWTAYNIVIEYWPPLSYSKSHVLRDGVAGMCASMAADTVSNSLRVLKIKRQATTKGSMGVAGYTGDALEVMASDGFTGLLFRGLGTRILCGAIQGAFFSVVWNSLL